VRDREARGKDKDKPTTDVIETIKPEPRRQNETLGPRKLGGASGSAEGVAGLTPEMRAKVERERRARAAEARLRTLSGN
jgi:hypothetical protein